MAGMSFSSLNPLLGSLGRIVVSCLLVIPTLSSSLPAQTVRHKRLWLHQRRLICLRLAITGYREWRG